MADRAEPEDHRGPVHSAQATAESPRVFISYASADKPTADAVCAALEQAGIPCWIASRDVKPGALYADAIVRAITNAKGLVLVLSVNAIASQHVGKEIERASSKKRPIIALRIDSAPLIPALEYFLSESQWIDARANDRDAAHAKLIDAIRDPQSGGAGGTPPASAASAAVLKSRGTHRWQRVNRVIVGLLALVAALAAYLVVDKLWLANPAPTNKQTATVEPAAPQFNPPPHSIAVLPFVNMSGDTKEDYFSDGITEELLNALANLDQLEVAARTSSFLFRGQNADISTIAHKLNVGTILEGSVRKVGATVRITVQLINATTGYHVWSQSYDRKISDILKVQTDVATSVAQQLRLTLVGDELGKLEIGGTKNAQAYDAYLRGIQLSYRPNMTEAMYREALTEFDQALTQDPLYSAAYAHKAAMLVFIFEHSVGHIRLELHDEARAAAARAVALAPRFGEAHLALAFTFENGSLEFAKAAREYTTAVALTPGSAYIQRNYALSAGTMGFFDIAIAAARRAVGLDPQNMWTHER